MMKYLSLSALLLVSLFASAQNEIRLNQIGFLPESQKIAVVNSSLTSFEIVRNSNSTAVYSGSLSASKYWTQSQEDVKIADFSDFKTRGTYRLKLPDGDLSAPFQIGDEVFSNLAKATIKAYYFNRASIELTEEFAGDYKRPLGHPDNQVVVHPSAASAGRPAGTVISTPYGWYDAGDYNKYIVNSGISVFTLLAAYENYQQLYDELDLHIPESGNDIPDLLDEVLWNLKWMATMQDPEDGGVYNKTTTANFQGAVMPHQATATRYVVAKGTAATLDFAASMAMAARIYQPYLPEFASECLEQAELAWAWAQANPNVPFINPGAQDGYPAVNTGGYGDSNFDDEFFWAAAELYITTGDDSYYSALDLSLGFGVPGWPNVQTLGILSLVTHRKALTAAADTTVIKKKLLDITNPIRNAQKNTSPYKIPNNEFYWGSNSVPANQGMLLMQAYAITGELEYYQAALGALDYLLGRNATGYCFVTGFGELPPMNIHHRQSEADNIAAPVPGFLAGGPNPHNTDDCGSNVYPSPIAAKCYVDNWCSYSTNEITINWNAPLVYLSGAIHHVYSTQFLVPDTTPLSIHAGLGMSIYPQPARHMLTVLNDQAPGEAPEVTIHAVDGKVVLQERGSQINVSTLPSGIYILTASYPNHSFTRRILIE